MNKTKPNSLPIRRVWGGTLNLFLAGDLFAAFFLPLWLAAGKEGITQGDAAQMILSCLLLFLATLAPWAGGQTSGLCRSLHWVPF